MANVDFRTMRHLVSKIALIKADKVGLRRCIYRRWEAKIVGASILLRVITLERLYRGNTPYSIGKPCISEKRFATTEYAQVALRRMMGLKARQGYVKITQRVSASGMAAKRKFPAKSESIFT